MGGNKRFRRLIKSSDSSFLQIQLAGKLFLDVLNFEQLLLNGVDIDIELLQNSNSFPLISKTPFEFDIDEISLFVEKVKLNPAAQSSIESKLTRSPSIYPFIRGIVKTFDVLKSNRAVHHENLFFGSLPSKIFIGFVNTASFHGDAKKNPFYFENFNINFLSIYKNGVQMPARPYQPDFENKQVLRSYFSLFKASNTFFQNKSVNITLDDYQDGYTLWGFDLTADKCSEDYYHSPETGNIKLELRFAEALNTNVTAIIYADFNCILQITKNREVITNYII